MYLKLLSLVLLCFISQSLFATTYFVEPSPLGSNSNSGTLSQPFQTVQFALDQCLPGDSVQLKNGDFVGKVSFNNSGNAGNPITLTGFGYQARILGTNLSPSGREGLVTISSQSYVKVSWLEIADFKISDSNLTPVGVLVDGNSHDVVISSCDIYDIEQNATTGFGGANGIGVYGTDAQGAIYNLEISANSVANCLTFWSEVVTLNGNVRDFTVFNNLIRESNNIGLDFIGWEGECAACTDSTGANVDRARDGIVYRNNVEYIDTKDNPAYGGERSAAGIYVDGGANIIIEQNSVYRSNFGIELASEHYLGATENITVRNNLLSENHVIGISTGGYDAGTGPGGGSAENCLILNNTLYRNHESFRPQDNFGGEIVIANRNINNVYKNNIVVASGGFPFVDEWGSLNAQNVFGSMLYYANGTGPMPGMTVNANPNFLLTGPYNFTLLFGSPAIDAGESLPASQVGQFEYFPAFPRVSGGQIDIGAREYQFITAIGDGLENRFSIAPNPGGLTRHVQLPAGSLPLQMQLIDLSGKRFDLSFEDGSNRTTIHLPAGLAHGVYYLVIQTEKQVFKEPLIY